MIERPASPIFAKTYDLLQWLVPLVTKYPKDQRFRLARRVEDSAFAFYELLMQAARERDPKPTLRRADLDLDRLRLYLRLSRDLELISFDQYEHAARQMVEIGKLLGGWLKKAD